MNKQFLTVNRGKIVGPDGKPDMLRGTNLGSWLMPEAYFMYAPSWGYRFFKEDFIKAHGQKTFTEIERAFRDNWIQADDFGQLKKLGFNCLRLPFHFGAIEKSPFKYSSKGVGYLDQAIRWARQSGLTLILDMHAVPGAQNHEWHSDSDGTPRFWTNAGYQRRAVALWEFLADRYKDEPGIAGYDILNETVYVDPRPMNKFYHAAIKAIRKVDRNHIIFIEGGHWAQRLDQLDEFSDDNLALSIHFYEPLEFTFNLIPQLKYPLKSKVMKWDGAYMRKRLDEAKAIADKWKRPLWCGEFGVNARAGIDGEDRWLNDILNHFNTLDIHWSYWTWKAVKHHMFPDGIMSYYPNPPWVNRQGPVSGWNTWKNHWPAKKKEMIASWRTRSFSPNPEIVSLLKQYAR